MTLSTETTPAVSPTNLADTVDFTTEPARYRHWNLAVNGETATLTLDIDEDGGIRPGYKLKLNSYDLGVDIELNDAVNRLRYEHPSVRCVVLTSGKPKMFCSGANIYMLGVSSHAWKVNFCKFTNETRNGIEDSSRHNGLKFLAAVNGACAGGGYEMALACDEILMVDDRSSAVSLPEVPLLGVLPGTGGLTRLVDKRQVRRDLADVFCTTAEGVRADRAKAWRLVDHIAKPAAFEAATAEHAARLAQTSDRGQWNTPVALKPLTVTTTAEGFEYEFVSVKVDRTERTVEFTLRGAPEAPPATPEQAVTQGADFWPLAFVRQFEDAVLRLRSNEVEAGLWLFKSQGSAERMMAFDAFMHDHADHGFIREVNGSWRRMLSRLDVSSRSMFTLIEPGACFAGVFAELVFAADRSYMLDSPEPGEETALILGHSSFGRFPMASEQTRLDAHFSAHTPEAVSVSLVGQQLSARQCDELGLVTAAPDDLDYPEEVRIAIEERVALSPDALTGLEASLRFSGPETMLTRIFGRLTAWQNWIFNRPNAVGDAGALKVYGSGSRPEFDFKRV
ncbi:MAG: 2,3-epoxybenzoyl-CoA dihydrolase [Burkholderiaceae bacterium]